MKAALLILLNRLSFRIFTWLVVVSSRPKVWISGFPTTISSIPLLKAPKALWFLRYTRRARLDNHVKHTIPMHIIAMIEMPSIGLIQIIIAVAPTIPMMADTRPGTPSPMVSVTASKSEVRRHSKSPRW